MINKEICLFESVFLISMMFFVLFITSIMFIFDVKISDWNFILAALCSFTTVYYFTKSIKRTSIISLMGVFIIFACSFLFGHFYDWSWDGNTYHKGIVAMLKNGWNPLAETFYAYTQNKFPFMDKATYTWYDTYPKGSEIWGGDCIIYRKTLNLAKVLMFYCLLRCF